MEAAIYRYKTDARADDVITVGQKEFIPQIKQLPGFVGHYTIDLGKNESLFLVLFQESSQVQQFHKMAQDWIQKKLAPQFSAPYNQAPLEVSFGHVKSLNTPTERHFDAVSSI